MFKNILYIHGIGSTGGGNTVTMLRKAFPNSNIDSPEIPTMPKEAFKFIRNIVKDNKYDFIIGTSLGGFYTMMISGIPKLLINPALHASTDIETAIGRGTHNYFNKRKSGEVTYTVDDVYINELKELENRYYNNWKDSEYVTETRAIFGTKDELLNHINDYKNEFNKNNMRTAEFGHRMTSEVFNSVMIPYIEEIYKEVTNTNTNYIEL